MLLDLTKQLALEVALSPAPYFRPYLIISKLYLTWFVFVLLTTNMTGRGQIAIHLQSENTVSLRTANSKLYPTKVTVVHLLT